MIYRVRAGVHHGARRQYGPGALVELTEQEVAGFLDKLEAVQAEPAPLDAAPIVPEPEQPAPKPARRKQVKA